jgi:hypothetical protein
MNAEFKPTFSLAFTSVRPNAIPVVVALWSERAKLWQSHPIEWIIAVDEGDKAALEAALSCNNIQQQRQPHWQSIKIVTNKGPKTSVAGWNLAAETATGKVIIAVADDFIPPVGWDELLLSIEPKNWIEGEHVVHVNDGFVQNLCTLAIMTRKRYERYGYLWYPKYESMFCDTEFTDVAHRDGVVIEAMHLLFEHAHCDCGKRPRDEADNKHSSSSRWRTGEQLFNFRRSQGFPLDDGPKAVKTAAVVKAVSSDVYCVYMQVTDDDLCLLDICMRMKEEGVLDIFWAEPDEYWSGEPLEPSCKLELDAVAEKVRAAGINLRRRVFSCKSNRMPGDSRITVETRVRNDSLRWIRSEGFKHILIVDGDELWKPGTLSAIKAYVQQGHTSVATYMIPVIGLPGWPVGEATDTAVVYIGGTSVFKCCRSPLGRYAIIPSPMVIHFTGTRRTMEDTITKHKRSGHYDDPDYLFEMWIKEVLPNIRPNWTFKWPNGIEGLHMFQPKQIWPRVREWLPEEWAAIPEATRKYVGTNA